MRLLGNGPPDQSVIELRSGAYFSDTVCTTVGFCLSRNDDMPTYVEDSIRMSDSLPASIKNHIKYFYSQERWWIIINGITISLQSESDKSVGILDQDYVIEPISQTVLYNPVSVQEYCLRHKVRLPTIEEWREAARFVGGYDLLARLCCIPYIGWYSNFRYESGKLVGYCPKSREHLSHTALFCHPVPVFREEASGPQTVGMVSPYLYLVGVPGQSFERMGAMNSHMNYWMQMRVTLLGPGNYRDERAIDPFFGHSKNSDTIFVGPLLSRGDK